MAPVLSNANFIIFEKQKLSGDFSSFQAWIGIHSLCVCLHVYV